MRALKFMSKPRAYYNDSETYVCEWLRNLIKAGLIPDGDVDNRSIRDVQPEDLRGYTQCHFFAGIGGWAYALRLAGWPDGQEVWTGSCPCQPFSSAGQRKGASDPRHLWPEFFRLISECAPSVVFGEQVASKDGLLWLAGVRADMEASGYALAAADLCAAGVSAPHIRQRLYWVGHANGERPSPGSEAATASRQGSAANSTSRADLARLVNANGYHSHWWSGPVQVGWNGCEAEIERGGRKYRVQWRIKPGLSIVANGIPGRVGKLCGAGNAIVPQVAAEFIGAYLDVR